MNKHRVLFCLLLVGSSGLYAQTSVIQDDDGKSSIYMIPQDSIAINFNAADKGLTISFVDNDVLSTDIWYFGGQLTVGGKDGKIPITKNGLTSFEAELGVTATLIGERANDFFYVSPKFSIGRVETAALSGALITRNKETSASPSIQVGYNNLSIRRGNREFLRHIIMGVAVNAGWNDNVKLIDTYQYSELRLTGGIAGGGTAVVATEQTDVYLADEYKEGMLQVMPMVDVGYKIYKARLIPMLHLRWDLYPGETVKRIASPGAGIYFTEKNSPNVAIVGLQVFYKDWTNAQNAEDSSRPERASVNLVVGFKF
jgi:hypothetical protein